MTLEEYMGAEEVIAAEMAKKIAEDIDEQLVREATQDIVKECKDLNKKEDAYDRAMKGV